MLYNIYNVKLCANVKKIYVYIRLLEAGYQNNIEA